MKKDIRIIWSLAGLSIGAIMIIVGIVFMSSPADSYSTNSARDATFGADFYTIEYEATQAAANNTAITANNIRELGEKLALYCGFSLMAAGAVVVVHFGKQAFPEVTLQKNSSVAPSRDAQKTDADTFHPADSLNTSEEALIQKDVPDTPPKVQVLEKQELERSDG